MPVLGDAVGVLLLLALAIGCVINMFPKKHS